MKYWIQTHKQLFIAICCLIYVLATGVPVMFSYGLIADIRPVIIISDIIVVIAGVINLIEGTM